MDSLYLSSVRKKVRGVESVEGCLIWRVENKAVIELNLWEQPSFWTPPQAATGL